MSERPILLEREAPLKLDIETAATVFQFHARTFRFKISNWKETLAILWIHIENIEDFKLILRTEDIFTLIQAETMII